MWVGTKTSLANERQMHKRFYEILSGHRGLKLSGKEKPKGQLI